MARYAVIENGKVARIADAAFPSAIAGATLVYGPLDGVPVFTPVIPVETSGYSAMINRRAKKMAKDGNVAEALYLLK